MPDRPNGAPPEEGAKRTRTRAEERIDSLDTSAAGMAAEMDELKARAERAEQEAAENKAGWQRSAADFANYRRRTDQQREEELGLANEMLLLKLLTVADDFDRAVAHVPADQRDSAWVEGIAAIDRKLRGLIESQGVTPAEPAEGLPFDPREHEAVSYEESSEVPDGTVLRELARGYRMRDRVLRPSLVSVGKGGPATARGRAPGSAPVTTSESTQTKTNTGAAPDDRE